MRPRGWERPTGSSCSRPSRSTPDATRRCSVAGCSWPTPLRCSPPGWPVACGASCPSGAWATSWKRFRPYLTVRGSYMVITEPAPERLEQIGWTGGEAVRSMRSSIHYLRTTRDGRIAFGLGGLQPDLARKIDRRYAYDEQMVRRVAFDLRRMFPTFRDVPIEAGWGGPINVSGLNLPFFGTTGHDNVHHGLGYTGNGVGPSHLGGKILALRALGRYENVLELPLVDAEPKRFPPEPIRSPGGFLVNRAIRRKDDFEDRGEELNPLVDFAARLPRRIGFRLGP